MISMAPMAPQADRAVARTARLLTLLAPGLGHLYLRATWRAFFVTVPLLVLSYVMLAALPVSGARLPNLVLLYAWYLACYQVGAQLDLTTVLEAGPPPPRRLGSVMLALLLVVVLPLVLGGYRVFSQRAGAYVASDDGLYPVVQAGEVVLFRRAALLERGELVVFRQQGVLRAARIVGLPGDRVRHQGARLEINGAALPEQRLGPVDVQGAGAHATVVAWQERQEGDGYLVFRDPDTTPTLQKPEYLAEGRYWLLCDARDAATCADSRTLGPIEQADLVGTPTHVLVSPVLARIGFAIFSRANLTWEP